MYISPNFHEFAFDLQTDKEGNFYISKGAIGLKERKRLHFSFGGNGKATLAVGGEEVLTEEGTLGAVKSKRLRLNPGEHEITVAYRSAEDGSGEFRLYWEEEEMPRQSVPPAVFSTTPTDEAKLGGEKLPAPDPALAKAGGVVFHELGCIACHDQAASDASRVPLNNVASKYLPGQAARYFRAHQPLLTSMPERQKDTLK